MAIYSFLTNPWGIFSYSAAPKYLESYKIINTLTRHCEPRIERLIEKGAATVVKSPDNIGN